MLFRRGQSCRRCAAALTSDPVRALLVQSYTLADDFQFAVFDPDDPGGRNYCAPSEQ